ncbi:MAG: hypothetical protein ACOKSU_22370 [Pseudomonas sp.]|uniref:hypothetical protein n=1 Tax=Pseudomonas TaxID=286 RepID=UPI0003C088A5|nr:hypothetical protein [Pseudomonas sp. VLB120]AGZ33918.1 hypothetical protein PVLB_05555 [Pseudomonas sp. VLB120]
MKFHFALDGIPEGRQETLLSIEAAMPTGRHRLAVFNLKSLQLRTSNGPERCLEYVSSRLGAFLLGPLEETLKATGLDLIRFYHAIKAVPVVLTAR